MIKNTAYWKRLAEERKHPAIDRFAEERAIDPRRDIYELVFASDGEKDGATGWCWLPASLPRRQHALRHNGWQEQRRLL